MTETFKKMQARHEQEIANLQKNCKHPQVSNWLPYMWAPGHFSGQVKVCEICGKTVESKSESSDFFRSLP